MAFSSKIKVGVGFFVCILGVYLFIRYFVIGNLVVTYKDALVTGGLVRRPLGALVVHGWDEQFLSVGGRTYRRVRGLEPFYLALPKHHSILFMTDSGATGVEFHILNIDDWKDLSIYGEKLSFGNDLGGSQHAGDPYTDFVDKETPFELILATQYPHAKKSVFVDLKLKRITKVEYAELDERGSVTNNHVYVDGREVTPQPVGGK